MKTIRYILQMVIFCVMLLPSVVNATVTDPNFTECGLFPSALNTWDKIDQGNGDVVINSDTIYADGYLGDKNITCQTSGVTKDCIVEEFTANIPNLPVFIESQETTNITASGTLSDEKYGDIEVPANSNVTFSPSGKYNTGGPVMIIKSLTIQDDATVTFAEGDYWIKDWQSFAEVKIRTTGSVKLFIGNNLNLSENMIDFNYNNNAGEARDMFIFIYGDFIFSSNGGGNSQTMTAYVYVQGSFTANHNTNNSEFKGAVTSVGRININNNQTYQYDASGLDGGWGACRRGINYLNADDLCYFDVTYSVSGCTDTDEFQGGVGCIQTIGIRNLSNALIESHGDIFILDHSGIIEIVASHCGVDGSTYDWGTVPYSCEAVANYPIADMDSIDGVDGNITNYIRYSYLTFEPNAEHSIFSKSLISASMFDGGNLYAVYFKNGATYGGRVDSCEVNIQFELEGYEVSEDINRMYLTEPVHPIIKINKTLDHDVSVTYYTSDGTATVGLGDYIAKRHTVTIPAGKRRVAIELLIYNDQPIESFEHFFVHLEDSTNGVEIGYVDTTKVTILAQDDAPTCFEDNFDDLHDDWRVLKSAGGFTPKIVDINGDGRLRLTDRQNHLSTAITRDVEFESTQNLIIIEFKYYAYGGCADTSSLNLGDSGADGIVNILFDSNVGEEPEVGGFGGSMGYAQFNKGIPYNGFEGGWLGLGLDEYGEFGRENEGRIGGRSNRHENLAVIRGKGTGMTGYKHLADIKVTGNEINELGDNPIADKNANDYLSGLYKMTIDARTADHLNINLMRAENGDEGDYQTIIELFDAKTAQPTIPEKLRYAISGATGDGCNNHEISWIKLRGNCSNFTPSGSYTTGPFASQDMWRKVNQEDFNISTKIVNKAFKLRVLSLDETHKKTEIKNGIDARWSLKYIGSGSKAFLYDSTYYNIKFDSSQNKEETVDIIVDKAYKNMYIEMTYCAEYDPDTKTKTLYPWSRCGEITSGAIPENQPAEGRRYYFHEGDHFAVRPEYFDLTPAFNQTLTVHAGENYNVIIRAYNGGNSLTQEYNRELSDLSLEKKLFLNNGDEDTGAQTLDGTLTFEVEKPIRIVNGLSREINSAGNVVGSAIPIGINFDDVAKVEFEIMDETWAEIDADDSPSECMTKADVVSIQAKFHATGGIDKAFSRYVCTEKKINITFIPDHFEILEAKLINHRVDGDFTYLSNDIENMSGSISLKIEAKNSKGELTRNFNRESTGYTYPDDNSGHGRAKILTDKYYENPIKLTFELKDSDGNPYNPHSLKDDTLYKLKKKELDKNTMLGFNAGVYIVPDDTKILIPYYLRKNNEPVMPFSIKMEDVKIKVESNYDGEIISGEGIIESGSIDFYYARVKPTIDFYDNIVGTKINTPVMLTIYCSELLDGTNKCNYNAIHTSGKTNERNWYKAKGHDSSKNDGDVTIVRGTYTSGNPTVSKTLLEIDSSGVDNEVVVLKGGNNPTTVQIELANIGVNMSPWLIYGENLDGAINSSDKPSPFYKVRFIDEDSTWTGIGEDGSVVDRDTNKFKNNRMDW